MRQAVPDDDPLLLLRDGKMVIEIRPRVDWNKGQAVLVDSRELHLQIALEVYIGDDSTDEDAFQALAGGDHDSRRRRRMLPRLATVSRIRRRWPISLKHAFSIEKELYSDPG